MPGLEEPEQKDGAGALPGRAGNAKEKLSNKGCGTAENEKGAPGTALTAIGLVCRYYLYNRGVDSKADDTK
ncbi:MAG: hypothetical protein ACKODX_03290 [Gemmata sp.]